jgi:hypothetical protein
VEVVLLPVKLLVQLELQIKVSQVETLLVQLEHRLLVVEVVLVKLVRVQQTLAQMVELVEMVFSHQSMELPLLGLAVEAELLILLPTPQVD